MSSASTGRRAALMARITASVSARAGGRKPVPNNPSTMTSLPESASAAKGCARPPAASHSSCARRASPPSLSGGTRGEHQRLEPGGLREARQHVAVAAVVAGAAHHRDAPRLRPAGAQQLERGLARRASSA